MKFASMAWLAIDPDFAPLHFNKLFAYGEAETCTLSHSCGCVAHLVKLVEDALTFQRWNTHSRIGDSDLHIVAILNCRYTNFSTWIGELYAIAE